MPRVAISSSINIQDVNLCMLVAIHVLAYTNAFSLEANVIITDQYR